MRIVFIGASGHGKVCAEIAEMNGYDEILFLDDNGELKECGGYPVEGAAAGFGKYVDEDTEFFVSIGNAETRKRIQEEIKEADGKIARLIHPESVISRDVKTGVGSVVMAGAVINTGTAVGEGVIVNTSSSIDHDCIIGDYSHISVGAHLCGGVRMGSGIWIGAGTVVNNNLYIPGGCVIGAGAVVIKDIEESGTYVGVPARKK